METKKVKSLREHLQPPSRIEAPGDFEILLQRCADKAYNFAFRLTGKEQEARDLVQEAFARAFEHKDRYDPRRPFESWLYRILQNIFLDSVRRYEKKHLVSLDAPPSADGVGSWEEILVGGEREPLGILEKREEEQAVQKALNALSIHFRTAVVLYDIEGLSYDEISKVMEIPIGTVCSRIHQGRVELRKLLGNLGKTNLLAGARGVV